MVYMHLTNTIKNNDCVVTYVACLSLSRLVPARSKSNSNYNRQNCKECICKISVAYSLSNVILIRVHISS